MTEVSEEPIAVLTDRGRGVWLALRRLCVGFFLLVGILSLVSLVALAGVELMKWTRLGS
jgi:hypothetical protein